MMCHDYVSRVSSITTLVQLESWTTWVVRILTQMEAEQPQPPRSRQDPGTSSDDKVKRTKFKSLNCTCVHLTPWTDNMTQMWWKFVKDIFISYLCVIGFQIMDSATIWSPRSQQVKDEKMIASRISIKDNSMASHWSTSPIQRNRSSHKWSR